MRRIIHLQEHFPLAFDETFNSCYQLRKKSNITDIRLRGLYLLVEKWKHKVTELANQH